MYMKFKRLIDIILSLIGLIVLSPVFLILIIAIKLDSKGQNIVKQLDSDMYLKETDLQYVVNRNTQLNRPTTKHKKHDDFFRIFDSVWFDEAVDHCIPEPPLIKKIASKILPLEVKRLIKSIINNSGGI